MRKWLQYQFRDNKAAARTIFVVGSVGGSVGFALVLIGTVMLRFAS